MLRILHVRALRVYFIAYIACARALRVYFIAHITCVRATRVLCCAYCMCTRVTRVLYCAVWPYTLIHSALNVKLEDFLWDCIIIEEIFNAGYHDIMTLLGVSCVVWLCSTNITRIQ